MILKIYFIPFFLFFLISIKAFSQDRKTSVSKQDALLHKYDSLWSKLKDVRKKIKKEEAALDSLDSLSKIDSTLLEFESFRAGHPASQTPNEINFGVSYSVIDKKKYFGFVSSPKFNIGPVGIGLDLPFLVGVDSKSFRSEMYTGSESLLRLVRYARWYRQQKVDSIYVNVGPLNNVMIGYGGLVNNYSNSLTYEKRNIGVHYDINIKDWGGIEGMYSDFNFSSFNLFVIRPYITPFKNFTKPISKNERFNAIIKSLEIGATFVRDQDQHTLRSDYEAAPKPYKFTQSGVGAWGIDVGLSLFRFPTVLGIPMTQIDLFGSYSKLNVKTQALTDSIDNARVLQFSTLSANQFKNGGGGSLGLNLRFVFTPKKLTTDLRVDRFFTSRFYNPMFFNASYQINKDQEIYNLTQTTQNGTYVSVKNLILNKLTVGANLMFPDQVSQSNPMVFNFYANTERILNMFSLHGSYYKGGLKTLGKFFEIDEYAIIKLRFTYYISKHLMTGIDYFWTSKRENGRLIPEKYISPYFGIVIPLDGKSSAKKPLAETQWIGTSPLMEQEETDVP